MLRGQALQEALNWSADESLSNQNYQFLSASQELEKQDVQIALENTEAEAKQVLFKAQQQAKKTQLIGLTVMVIALFFSMGVVIQVNQYTQSKIIKAEREAQKKIN